MGLSIGQSVPDMKYPSAVDPWIYILAMVFPAVVLVVVAFTVEAGDTRTLLVLGLSALVALGLPVWLLVTTYYRVEAGTLSVKSGPMRWVIPLEDIQSVKPTSSLLSSPALSMKRLQINYGQGKAIMVSPRDMDGFIRSVTRA